MNKKFLLIGAALSGLAVPALADNVKPTCTDNSRDCMIAAAKSYLDSIVTHDASKVPFVTNTKRTEQGTYITQGETALRELQRLQPDMKGHANTRWFVDEKTHNVIAFTLLQVTGKKADPNRRTFTDGVPPDQQKPSTVHLAERFKVENGYIIEIEAIVTEEAGTMDGTSNWPDAK